MTGGSKSNIPWNCIVSLRQSLLSHVREGESKLPNLEQSLVQLHDLLLEYLRSCLLSQGRGFHRGMGMGRDGGWPGSMWS